MADFLTEQLRERLKAATEGKPAGTDPYQLAKENTYIPGVDGFGKLQALQDASERKAADIQRKQDERNAALKASQDSYVTGLGLNPTGLPAALVNEGAMLAANVGEGVGTAADMAGIGDGTARDFMRESLLSRVYRHDPNQDRPVADTLNQFAGSAYDALGKTARGLGALNKYVGDATTTPLMNAFTGREDSTPNVLEGAAQALEGMGKSTEVGISRPGIEAREGFTPTGSLVDPSSWSLGDNVTARGLMMRGSQIMGSLVPVVAASLATGGAAATTQSVVSGVAGGSQGGGAAISQARETIDKMATTRMPNGQLQIEAESETYRELIASGLSHEDAVKQTRDEAEKWAFALTAPVSALGGALTNKLLNPASKILDSRGVLLQALGRGTLSATEEGIQEVAEGIQTVSGVNQGAGTNLDPLEDSFGNLVLGALGGGPVGAVGGAVSGASNQVSKAATETQEAPATSAEVRAAADEAKKTGDISALTDPKSKAYSPEQAIATLYELSKGKEATPEAKQANLEKAGSVIADLETRRERVAAAIQSVSPEGIAATQAELADVKSQLASLPEGDPARDTLMELQASMEADLADAAKDPQAAKRMGVVLSRIDRQLEGAQKVLTTFQRESVPADLNVDTELATVEGAASTDPVAAQASVARVLSLAMAAPQRVSAEQVERLMALPDEVVNPAQKNYLRKLSDARVAANEARDLDGVSQEVMIGSSDNMGIAQYQKRIGASLASGNRRSAERDLDLLSNFAADHEAKAIAYEAAYKEGRSIQMVKTKDGAWIESPVELTEEQLKRNGGNEISARSTKLVRAIRAEANALNTAAAELQAAIDLRFPTSSTQANQSTVATNDQDVSQAAVGTTPIEATADQTTAAGSNVGGRPEGTEQGNQDQQGTATEQAEATVETTATQEAPASSMDQSETTSVDTQGEVDAASVNAEAEVDTDERLVEEDQQSVDAALAPQTSTEVSGVLGTMADKSPEGTAYQSRNLIADFFAQVTGRDGDASPRPLVAVKNFLSAVADVTPYLASKTLTKQQDKTVETLRKYATEWNNTLRANLQRGKSKEFFYKNLAQYLMIDGADGQLDLEENVKTAITVAAFNWIGDSGTQSLWNSPEEIAAILGKNDEDFIPSAREVALLGKAGVRQNVVTNSIGQAIVDALGLKALPNAPKNLQPDLIASLGAHGLKLLLDQGLATRTTVSGKDLAPLLDTKLQATVDPKASFYFIRMATEEDGTLYAETQEILDSLRGSQGILSKLFSVESGMKEPTFEPVKFNQRSTKGTSQGVPTVLAKLLQEKNETPYKLRQDLWHVLSRLPERIAFLASGAVDLDEVVAHEALRPSLEAKNDGLIREWDNLVGFINGVWANTEDGLDSPIYMEHSVWKQQRVGISTNVVNPQTSKIHRHMLFMPDWESTVTLDNEAQMENFRLRVMEGFGVKTDKQSNEASMAQYQAKMETEVVSAGVEALRRSIYEDAELTVEEQFALEKAILAGGENFHSLDALMALAHYEQAKQTGAPSFKVSLMGEVDGVTNGPMLSQLFMGAANSPDALLDTLQRGGFYADGSGNTNYNVWRGTPGSNDLYEVTASHMVAEAQAQVVPGSREAAILSAIYNFTGELVDSNGTVKKAGRNIVKTPLTSMTFGSSLDKSVDGMFNKFVEGVYGRMEDVAKGEADKQALVDDLRTLGVQVNPNISNDALLKLELKEAHINAMRQRFNATLGEAVKATLKEDFGLFMEQRKQLNAAAQLSWELYNAAFEGLREQKLAELVASGEIATNKLGQPVHDLTAAQEQAIRKELNKITPVAQTLMSQDSNQPSAGLYMSKSERKLSDKSMYESEVTFGSAFGDTGKKSLRARGYERVESAPGVAMAPMLIHSTDSAISHYAGEGHQSLNVHDARGAGLDTFQDTAQRLNEQTWNALLNFSPVGSIADATSRIISGLSSLAQEGKLPQASLDRLQAVLQAQAKRQKSSSADVLFDALMNIKASAEQADSIKLGVLSKLASIDQYALEGGQFNVTPELRAEAQAKLTAQAGQGTMTQAEADAINSLLASLRNPPQAPTAASVAPEVLSPQADPEIAVEGLSEAPLDDVVSFWGTLGTPDTKPDPQLEKFLTENPKAGAKKLFSAMTKIVEGQPDSIRKTFNLALIKQLALVLPENTEVLYITRNTPASTLADAAPIDDWSGLYIPPTEGEAPKILIRSSDFKDSALNIYVLLHELTHAATAELIHGVEQGTVTDPAAIQLVRNLEALLEQVKATVGNDPVWQHHVTNIHELVAYGMSDPAFQRVLNSIQVPTKSKTNPFITGAKAFVRSMVDALFTGSTKTQKQIAESGLTHLITQTAGVMQAQKNLMKPAAKRKGPSLAMAAVQRLSTTELFDALADYRTDPEFAARQREVLGNIVEKLHGAFGSFKASLMQKAAASPMDAWLKALATDQAPFGNDLVAAPLRSTEQEMYVVDQVYAVMKTALDTKESQTVSAYRELAKLYTEARKKLKGNPALTQEQYDYIFEVDTGADGRSNYLARFAALALGHKQVSSLLSFDTARTERVSSQSGAPTSIGDRIQNLMVRVLEFFANKVNRTYAGQRADFKVQALVEHLVDIEAKRKLALSQKATNYMAPIEDAAQAMVEGGRAKAAAFLRSDFFTKSKQKIVRGGASMARVVLEERGDEFMEAVAKFRNKALGGKQGVIMSLVNEYKGPAVFLQVLGRGTKKLEKDRKDLMTNVSRTLMKAFKDGGSYLKLEDKESLTRVLVRTGAHTLLDHFTMDEIQGLVSNKASREKAIADFEGRLDATSGFKEHYIEQANVLGYFKVTGINRGQVFMNNVHNIARMVGTSHSTKISESSASKEEATINALVALYALGYTNAADSNRVAEVLRTENARSEGNNGVAFMLQSHKQFEADSMERLFKGRPTQMMHGYTPEIYNPHISLKLADAEEGAALKLQGYVGGAVLETDPLDTQSGTQHIYAIKGAGLAPYLTGIMSFRGMSAKGSEVLRNHGFKNKKELAALSQAKEKALDADAKRTAAQGRRDLNKAKGNNLAQVVDEQGNVTAYRYLMQESTKDNLLDRDNRFEVVMGALAGSIMDKETAYDQNTKLIQALRDQFDQDYTSNPGAYLTVSASSDDPEMREIWAMIPDNTKQDIREIWGSDEIQIRNEMLDMTFGYRKRSLAEAFQQDPAARSEIAKITTYVFEEAYRQYGKTRLGLTDKEAAEYVKRAGFAAARGERAWQEVVREIKDIIVVKSTVVLLGNIWSNFSYLYMSGMSLKEIARTHKIALTAATDYQRASDELASLEMQVASSYYPEDLGGEVEMRRRIIELKDAIAGNPVKDLIDAGLMPTIAEDVLLDDDPYSYKTQFAEWTNNKTKFLPDGAKKAVNFMYMGKSTSMYQGLSRMTQLSDFVARYSYYTHMTTRAKNPLSRMDAIQSASDAFVNYDIPMHRNVQYMDDMGLIMFSKYFMRIQKVLIKLARENPARVLSTLALGQIMDLGPIVLDSGMLGRIGNNPLEWGAFQYPGTLDELGTMQAVEGGLKLLK